MNRVCKIHIECDGCDMNHSFLGCIDHDCPVWIAWDQKREQIFGEEFLEEKDG